MKAVNDVDSPWHGIIPVPRMVQNQLNHQLELELVQLDKMALGALHGIFKKSRQNNWAVATWAIFLLLHVRELDAGRIIHWSRHEDPERFWIHPSRPTVLIKEVIASCEALLCHYHLAFGTKRLSKDLDLKRCKALVGGDERLADTIRELRELVILLENRRWIGREGREAYEEGNSGSVASLGLASEASL
ncbi:hypothetical protein BKA56DRAFT_637557 [Ilyonectria sp. MPI-CAGE-AT-0026]|nr:hypothetical protein BKA56DRAFT_637557 [Ilyonectria sp. MPI-CAGE-AT-0026]